MRGAKGRRLVGDLALHRKTSLLHLYMQFLKVICRKGMGMLSWQLNDFSCRKTGEKRQRRRDGAQAFIYEEHLGVQGGTGSLYFHLGV